MQKKNRILIAAVICIAAIALFIAGMVFLPDTLTTQIGFDGKASNTMSKLPALALPTILAAAFAVLYARSGEIKQLVVGGVGLLVLVIAFVVNL